MPGRGSIAKYTKEYDELPSDVKNLDQIFRWAHSEEHGLPWESNSFLLPMWAWVRESGPFPTFDMDFPLPTIREVRWWWRIHLAIHLSEPPSIPKGKSFNVQEWHYSQVWTISQLFLIRDLTSHLLGKPLELDDLEGYLAYRAYDPDHQPTYLEAVEKGRVPPITVPPWEEEFPADIPNNPMLRLISKVVSGDPTAVFPGLIDGRMVTKL